MRRFIIITCIALILLSVVAWRLQPAQTQTGKVPLLWVSDDNPVRRDQISLFNKLNPICDLKIDPANAGASKVIVQSLAGVGPDLFDCYSLQDLSAFADSGIAWDVTDELLKMGVDVKKTSWSPVLPNCVYKGRVYGCGTNVTADAIWLNKDIFRKSGIELPKGSWTWQEFLPLAKKLTIVGKNGRVEQFGLLIDWYNTWQQFIWQWGGRVYNENGTKCIVDNPQAIAAIQFMQDLVYKYKVAPSPSQEQAATSGGWGSGNVSFLGAGKAAMALGGRWWLCMLRDYKDLHLGAMECPYYKVKVYKGYGRATLINKNSPHRKEALKFLVYLAGKDYNELVNHQADGIAPMIKASETAKFLHDPDYPDEDFNAVFRDELKYSQPEEMSMFINGPSAIRIFQKQLDQVKGGTKAPADALRAAQMQINAEIQRNIERDPKLRAMYEKLTKKPG